MNNAGKGGGLTIIPSAAAKVPAYPINSAGNTIDTAVSNVFPEVVAGNPPDTAVLLFVLQIAAD
ncbi:MAG TPA: hypothetical protein VK108_01980 [Pseudogracilibacillus sp.]|nr:hypothetical protein [Pseudogracilibacillus sp.]